MLTCSQAGTLLSWGRPTYGRLGQDGVDVEADSALPQPMPVHGLEEVAVVAASAGAHSRVDGLPLQARRNADSGWNCAGVGHVSRCRTRSSCSTWVAFYIVHWRWVASASAGVFYE